MVSDEAKELREVKDLLKAQNRTLNRIADMYKKEQSARLMMCKRITMMERNIMDIRQKYAGGDESSHTHSIQTVWETFKKKVFGR